MGVLTTLTTPLLLKKAFARMDKVDAQQANVNPSV
jgi:hypothetical protein